MSSVRLLSKSDEEITSEEGTVERKEGDLESQKKLVLNEYQAEIGEGLRKKFEDLANKRAEFKNVGIVKSQYKECSGVYIASRLVVTIASGLPHGFLSNNYILPNAPQITFSVEDEKGIKQTARVIFGTTHPDYREDYYKKWVFSPRNDIALLLLDRELKSMGPIRVNFLPSRDETNCMAVGYTNQYPTFLKRDVRVPILKSQESVKIATVFPSLPYETNLRLHMITLGYSSSTFTDSCCCIPITYSNINMEKPNYEPFEIGLCNGMSGGGYFNNLSLLGITVLTVYPAFSGYKQGYSCQFLDQVYCLPLSLHHAWIKSTIAMYEERLTELDQKMDVWNKKNRENPERKEDKHSAMIKPPEDALLEKVNIFVRSLIVFKEKHLKPTDILLNKVIDKFLTKKFEAWYDVVSEIQNALLNKGYSVKQPTLFGRSNNNIIGDIQEIIYLTNDIIKGIKLNPRPKFK